MSDVTAIIVALALVLVLIVLGAAESALLNVSRARAEGMRDEEVRGSLELLRLIDDRPRMIAPSWSCGMHSSCKTRFCP